MSNNKQSSVDKEFLPYEEALVLKKLGFDEPCYKYIYIGDTATNVDHYLEVEPSKAENHNEDSLSISQPTFSQAFRWFRDKDLNGEVYSQKRPKDNFMYAFRISGTDIIEDGFTSYEEAELACLKKLIQIAIAFK